MSAALGKKQSTRRGRVLRLKNSGNGRGEMAQQANGLTTSRFFLHFRCRKNLLNEEDKIECDSFIIYRK
jgi:hypothetical protein